MLGGPDPDIFSAKVLATGCVTLVSTFRLEPQYSFVSSAVIQKYMAMLTWESSLPANELKQKLYHIPQPCRYRREFRPLVVAPCNRARIEPSESHAYFECFKHPTPLLSPSLHPQLPPSQIDISCHSSFSLGPSSPPVLSFRATASRSYRSPTFPQVGNQL